MNATTPPQGPGNLDADWDRWPVTDYLADNYRQLHPFDLAVIEHHSRLYASLDADSIERSLELGAGPNLYPLLLAGRVSRCVEAVEPSAASVAYLRQQCLGTPDSSWNVFLSACRQFQPGLSPDLAHALARVRIRMARADQLPVGIYGLASMNFVAESVTTRSGEFREICHHFAAAVRPGGYLVASFMENMGTYRLADGSTWPAYPVDAAIVAEAFSDQTTNLKLAHVDADPSLPDYGYSGMVLLTARRRFDESTET